MGALLATYLMQIFQCKPQADRGSNFHPVDQWIWDMISVKQSPTFRFCFRQKIIQISKSWIFTMWPVDQGPNRKLHWSPTPVRSWDFWEFSARGADLFHKLSLWALGGKEHLSIHFVRPVTAQWRPTAIVDGVETGWNWYTHWHPLPVTFLKSSVVEGFVSYVWAREKTATGSNRSPKWCSIDPIGFRKTSAMPHGFFSHRPKQTTPQSCKAAKKERVLHIYFADKEGLSAVASFSTKWSFQCNKLQEEMSEMFK